MKRIFQPIQFAIVSLVVGMLLVGCDSARSRNSAGSGLSDSLVVEMAGLPVVAVTSGDKQHWFGYYDKFQIDPTGRFALVMEVDTFMRSPMETDTVRIKLIDLERGYASREIGTSTAWGWQQGCMLQWLPGSDNEVIWNDREGDHFVSRIMNIETGAMRTLPKAIYNVSPDGTFAVGTEFSRIQYMRPGYGYAGIRDPYEGDKAPSEIGIYRMDLKTGASELIISIAEIAGIPTKDGIISDRYTHYFNHLLISPDNRRFIFLHRYKDRNPLPGARKGFITRMFVANVDGSDLFVIDDSGNTSHFIWKDASHITAWTEPEGLPAAFYEFKDKTNEFQIIGREAMPVNGHNTYIPHTDNEWILNDTYPDKESRMQTLYLYHVPTNRKVILGEFYAPPRFTGEWRCDLHPRISRDGRKVFFDSSHEGHKRQLYLIDISSIVFDE